MFKFSSNYILSALVVCAYTSTAFAVPSVLEARNTDARLAQVTACLDFDLENCDPMVVDNTCLNFSGTEGRIRQAVSSAAIQDGFVCTFFRDFDCPSSASSSNGGSVSLLGGSYPDFTQLPDIDGSIVDFNDAASSVSCSLTG